MKRGSLYLIALDDRGEDAGGTSSLPCGRADFKTSLSSPERFLLPGGAKARERDPPLFAV
jgi:hypothetical protein